LITLRLALSRAVLEPLRARAIREWRKPEGLIAELLARESLQARAERAPEM